MDYRGTGYSDGDLNTSGIAETSDLITVINYLRKSGYTKISLFGRSLGAHCGIYIASHFQDREAIEFIYNCHHERESFEFIMDQMELK